MKKTLIVFCLLFLQFISISAQVKIDGRIDPIQDTIYLNELIQVDYYSNELLRDGFTHFPLPRKISDSLCEYIICGGPSKSSLYLGCAAFRFKKPGINTIPKVYYKFANTDTIWSSNKLSVYVLDEFLDEKLIFRKKYFDRYIEDSLSDTRVKRFSTIVDSMSIINCEKSKPYLKSAKDIYKAKVNQEIEIVFSTNYLCLNCENYIISSSDTTSIRDPFILKTVDCSNLKTNLLYNRNEFIYFECRIEKTPAFNEWNYLHNAINLNEIQNNFNKFDRITDFKIKVRYRKPGTYVYETYIMSTNNTLIASKQIKVIIKK